MEELENELINLQERVNLLEIDLKDEKGLVKELEKTNRQLVAAIKVAAEEVYQNEIVDTNMEELNIGKGKEFVDKEDWIKTKIENWMLEVKR